MKKSVHGSCTIDDDGYCDEYDDEEESDPRNP